MLSISCAHASVPVLSIRATVVDRVPLDFRRICLLLLVIVYIANIDP